MKTKYILQTLVILFIAFTATAQQGINYKAIISDANSDILVYTEVTVQFTILENGTTAVYQESHNPTTDANGIIIVNIGEGTELNGDFDNINWGSNPHFLKTEIDKGDGFTDMGTTEFKTVPYALYARTSGNVPEGGHYIGESYGGGIVFCVSDDGQNGLIAATQDHSTLVVWDSRMDILRGATGIGLGAGEMNTTIIIATQMPDNQGGNFAAKVCADYKVTVGDITYGDWYLPSIFELNLLRQQKEIVGGFSFLYYWSSRESSTSQAFACSLTHTLTNQASVDKNRTYNVRAIRKF